MQSLSLSGQGCSLCLKPGAVKCCKFQPLFYNFHLGELSRKDSSLGGLSENSWLLPLGSRPKIAEKPYPRFCNFFAEEKGQCTIWSSRPPECVSYFCEGDKQLAVNFQQLNSIWHKHEAVVAQMALVELGFDHPKQLSQQLELFDLSRHPAFEMTESELKTIWGEFYGREVEFYQTCHKFSEGLDLAAIEGWV